MSTDQLLKDAKDRAYEYWATSNSGPTWAKALDRAVELGAEATYEKLCEYIRAVGFITASLTPNQEVDAADPVRMCRVAAGEFHKLRARVKELEEELRLCAVAAGVEEQWIGDVSKTHEAVALIRAIQTRDRRDYKEADAECDELRAQLMRCAHVLGIPEADTAYDVMTLHELCEIFMEEWVEAQELRERVKELER